jgi:iron complex outermembrane recepter protein
MSVPLRFAPDGDRHKALLDSIKMRQRWEFGMGTTRKTWLGAGALAVLTGVMSIGNAATAQAQESAGSQSAGSPALEEILVTAQRRVENLQNVPVSAQVIGAQTLIQDNFDSLGSLTTVVPAVRVGPDGASNDLYIRGVGSGSNESLDQSVGLFVDDIYHGRSRTTQASFLDLDRVEVLKGPQSTFFGNNAIAGALNVVSKKPGDTFDASARILYGMFGQYIVESAVGAPINDILAVRVAASATGGRGWIKDVLTGDDAPIDNNAAGRVTFLFRPVDDFDATFKVEGGKNRESGTGYAQQPFQAANCPPPPPIPASFGAPGCAAYLGVGGLPLGLNNNLSAQDPGEMNELSTFESVLTANYRQWGQTFTSVTGFYNYHFDLYHGNDGTPLLLLTTEGPEKYSQFSQEFRIASPTDQPIEYLGGAYFQSDQLYYGLENNFAFASVFFPPGSPLIPYLPLARDIGFNQGEHSEAAFGSVSWNVTDKLKISGGLRGTKTTKDYTQVLRFGTGTQAYGGFVPLPSALVPPTGFFGTGIPGTLSGNRDDHAWLPSAKIQYSIDPRTMVYASYAKGFLAGGFNGTDVTGVAANQRFSPEYAKSYEIGLKSEWFDRSVLFNVAVFRADYSDLQVSFAQIPAGGGPPILGIRNAATSRSQGVELETQWVVSNSFRLSADVTYLESFYVNYPGGDATVLQEYLGAQYQNLSGQATEFAPRWSGDVRATYTVNLPNGLKFITEASPFFSSRYYLHDNDDPFFEQGDYVRLDGRFSLESADGHWGVDVIGKNLTDRVIIAGVGGLYELSKEEPRNVAVQFRYHW